MRLLGLSIGLIALVVTGIAPAVATELVTYRAEYQVERAGGKKSGSSVWTVSYDAERGVYSYESALSLKGILRLAVPNPVREHSDFKVENGRIRPLEFWYEDGSRKGEDNFHVKFDWDAGTAVVNADGRRNKLALQSGILDRGSMQVAVMLDLANGAPGSYLLADEDSLKSYQYTRNGEAAIRTKVGTIETQSFIQQREGSSRRLLIWAAPEYNFLPVRMERQKNGETDIVFVLQSIEMSAAAAN